MYILNATENGIINLPKEVADKFTEDFVYFRMDDSMGSENSFLISNYSMNNDTKRKKTFVGQVTIPKEIRQKFNISKKSNLKLFIDDSSHSYGVSYGTSNVETERTTDISSDMGESVGTSSVSTCSSSAISNNITYTIKVENPLEFSTVDDLISYINNHKFIPYGTLRNAVFEVDKDLELIQEKINQFIEFVKDKTITDTNYNLNDYILLKTFPLVFAMTYFKEKEVQNIEIINNNLYIEGIDKIKKITNSINTERVKYMCDLLFSNKKTDNFIFRNKQFVITKPPLSKDTCFRVIKVKENIQDITIDNLKEAKMINEYQQNILKEIIKNKISVLVVGCIGTGKTTIINALINEISTDKKITTIEDVEEFKIVNEENKRILKFDARELESCDNISSIIHSSNSDYCIYSEINSIYSAELFNDLALLGNNVLGDIIASSAKQGMFRLTNLILQNKKYTNVPFKKVEEVVALNLDIIIETKRNAEDGTRYLEIYTPLLNEETKEVDIIPLDLFSNNIKFQNKIKEKGKDFNILLV